MLKQFRKKHIQIKKLKSNITTIIVYQIPISLLFLELKSISKI